MQWQDLDQSERMQLGPLGVPALQALCPSLTRPLRNVGNSCFVNSIVSALGAVPLLYRRSSADEARGLICEQLRLARSTGGAALVPAVFTRDRRFYNGNQEDAA